MIGEPVSPFDTLRSVQLDNTRPVVWIWDQAQQVFFAGSDVGFRPGSGHRKRVYAKLQDECLLSGAKRTFWHTSPDVCL